MRIAAALLSLLLVAPASADDAAEPGDARADEPVESTAEAEVIEIVDRAPPGAEAEVGTEQLERSEHDDIHKVLAVVAGVYVRDEDGYGLRPNIGIRGAAADRSAKITLLEDGVPIAPAPYSAPAAYYFPMVTRMARIEVIKGPAAIQHGPNTVGGVVDLHTEPMPGERAAMIDIAGGSDRYGKLHARAAERRARWGLMAEYVHLRTDGFKDIDGGGDSGFAKHDAHLWLRVHSAPTARVFHQVDLKAGWSAEVSDETYTGLTATDFVAAPQRRYSSTALDQMNWRHWRTRAIHRVELGNHLRIDTIGYRNDFHRAWGKIDGFVGNRDYNGILAAPTVGANAIYYAVLSGAADSSAPEDELIRGTNDRTFVSQGIDSRLSAEHELGATYHLIDAGIHLHHDRADRLRFEDFYRMTGGALEHAERPEELVLDSRASALALALHAQDQVRFRRLEATAGLRVEVISSSVADHLDDERNDDLQVVPIPGGGVQYHATDQLTVLAGVHRGFVPLAPSVNTGAHAETSVNYEAGARWRSARIAVDLIGFFSDYRNLKGTCQLATGCNPDQIDEEFDGGRVHIYGAEAQVAAEIALGDQLRLPLNLAYTLTESSFRTGFSSDFAGWGDVVEGDHLPYLPRHQAALSAAVVSPSWEISGQASWRGEARDVPGQGEVVADQAIEGLLTFDVAMHLRFHARAELYLTCNNLLDEQVIVARRPYGVRPNAPRLFALGYKARF